MAPFVSRYLTRLDEEISKLRAGPQRDCLVAERIAYLARRGRMQEAKQSLAVLQEQYRAAPVLEVNCWTLFADAMVQHYDDLKSSARDRFLRCQALGAAYGVRRMDALASSWLALIDYGRNDFAQMDQWVRRALDLASPDDHLVMSRACMVVATAFQYAGQSDLAAPWMNRGRTHNSALGDETTWSSTLHNFAWARLIDLRQRLAHGRATKDDLDLTRTSIESAHAFDEMARVMGLHALNEVLLAQIRSLEGRHVEASQLFARILPEAGERGLSQWLSILQADSAVSSYVMGDVDSAIATAQSAVQAIPPAGHPDDIASAHSRLAEFFERSGEQAAASSHKDQGLEFWRRHSDKQTQIVTLLGRSPLGVH